MTLMRIPYVGLKFLETQRAVRLVRAYSQIMDEEMRRALLELTEWNRALRGDVDGVARMCAATRSGFGQRRDFPACNRCGCRPLHSHHVSAFLNARVRAVGPRRFDAR